MAAVYVHLGCLHEGAVICTNTAAHLCCHCCLYTTKHVSSQMICGRLLKRRDLVKENDLVIVVSDIRPDDQSVVRSVQIRRVP